MAVAPISASAAQALSSANNGFVLLCAGLVLMMTPWMVFVLLWSTVIDLPLAHMVWAPGGFPGPDGLGALDVAGWSKPSSGANPQLLIGALAAVTGSAALQLKTRLRLDDSLDVLPVHGVAGHLEQLGIQASAALFTILWVGVGTYGVLIVIRQLLPLCGTSPEEQQGLDISAHGEEAYNTEFTG